MPLYLSHQLPLGFLKALCKLITFGWSAIRRGKVKVDAFVAYKQETAAGNSRLRKKLFLVVHNGTEKEVAVCGFSFEDSLRHKHFGRSYEKPIVVDKPLMLIPPGQSHQAEFEWLPANLVYPMPYFGVFLRDYRKIWVSQRGWRKVVQDYLRDFPDWARYKRSYRPVEFERYESGKVWGQLKSES